MSQSRKQSAVEVITSTTVGFVGSYVICWLTFSNITNVSGAALVSTLACTVWSLARGYTLRRYFNNKVQR